jgi:hypothetical protein
MVTVTASDGLATVDQSFAMTIGHPLSVNQKIIDSIYVNEFQSNVALADGGFVVTLASGEQDDLDPASYGGGILAQIYNADGTTRGSEFTVNTFTQHSQEDPSIAALTDGGFVVAWESENYPDHDGIFAQMYNADGTTRGLEFKVDIAGIEPNSDNPAIAALIDGGFAIAWMGGESSFDYGVLVQMYNADGTPQGSEFKAFGVEYYFAPSITSLIGGGFVVTAVVGGGSIAANANLDAYIAQIYNADGTPQGAEIQLGTTFITNATTSDRPIVALTDGGFVVALESSDLGGQDYKLSA